MGTDDPRKESYTKCDPCSAAAGEPVVYHFSVLTFKEPLWGEGYWRCPNGHKVEPPAIKAKPPAPATE